METDLQDKAEIVRPPPKRWRNWWRSRSGGEARCGKCGFSTTVGVGQEYSSHCTWWPSKDLAETRAAHWVALGLGERDYLGAYPEGERP